LILKLCREQLADWMAEKWKQKALAHWDLINRLAVRRFGSAPLAEEAALFVMDSLAANSWQRIQAHSGKGSFTSYLASLSYRLLEDFSRKRFGRVRPPLWITKLGGIWSLLFSLLCLERLSLSESVESASYRYPGREKTGIEDDALTLLGRIPQCGKQQGLERSLDESDETDRSGRQPEQVFEKDQQEHLFAALLGQVMGEEQDRRIPENFASLLTKGLELKPEERLLLKLLYQDNVGVNWAGRMLGLNRDQVNGRLRRLLARLRKEFQSMGLEEEVLEYLR
jgi:DNA-directed RNA polymerase specialized sigma24 family protein